MSATVNQTRCARVDGLRQRLRFWLRWDASRLLWPHRCLACDAPGMEGIDLCAECAGRLPWNRPACPGCAAPLPGVAGAGTEGVSPLCDRCSVRPREPLYEVHAALAYAAPVDCWIPRFKFHRDLAAGRLLAQLMTDAFADLPRPRALVPVPLHTSRLRRRGYDQALELARPLARGLDLPLLDHRLVRYRETLPQSQLDAEDRQRNLRGAFAVRPGPALPEHVALVDDVMTTGATLQAAAVALREAGVARVDAWICARVA